MQDLVAADAAGGPEIGADGVRDGQQGDLHDAFSGTGRRLRLTDIALDRPTDPS